MRIGFGIKTNVKLHLFAFLVEVHSKRGIFLLETVQCTREVGCFNPICFDGERDDGFRDVHGSLRGDEKFCQGIAA